MLTIDHLLTLCRAYGEYKGFKPSWVSTQVFGDGKKISRLENGADITSGRCMRAWKWFADNWPDTAVWPADVPHPHTPLAPLTPDAARDSGGGLPRPATSAAGPHPIGAPPELPRLAGVGARESAAAPAFFSQSSEVTQ